MKRIVLLILAALFLLSACGAAPEETTPATAAPETQAQTEAPALPPETEPASPYPQPEELVGAWERIWSEMEGDRSESESGEAYLTITGSGEEGFSATYWSRDFPEYNYSRKALTPVPVPLYEGCSNPEWSAAVDFTGPYDTAYALTIQEDGTLLLQNQFDIDGYPAVSYECFRRMGA